MNDSEIVLLVISAVGVFVSPIYPILFWRIKISNKIEQKVTRLCTALKLSHPELSDALRE
jgi:hypothetical protein